MTHPTHAKRKRLNEMSFPWLDCLGRFALRLVEGDYPLGGGGVGRVSFDVFLVDFFGVLHIPVRLLQNAAQSRNAFRV